MLESNTLKIVLLVGVTVMCLYAVETGAQEAVLERLTPILAVESIEPVVSFWEDLGFRATNPNRVDGKLIFIAFVKEGYQVHYQTLARLERDLPGAAEMLSGSTSMLYLTVSDLDAVIAVLGEAEVVIPRRTTPWGSDEIYVKEPGGHLVAFAEFSRN